MKTVLMADPVRYPRMNTDELRDTFLLSALCEPGKLHLNYVDLDRAVVGFASPLESPIALPTDPDLRATYFTERRELGALNIGGAGAITVEGKSYDLDNLDVLYIGRGNKQVSFASKRQIRAGHLLSVELSRPRRVPHRARPQGRRQPH